MMDGGIYVVDDERYHGRLVVHDGPHVWFVGVNAAGRIVPAGDDPDPVPPDVADAVMAHLNPDYVAPDYRAISA